MDLGFGALLLFTSMDIVVKSLLNLHHDPVNAIFQPF